MRKLYSLVLLAVGLLIGTNAWGQFSTVQLVNHTNPSASKGYVTLQDAIDAVAPGDTATITLLEEQNLTASIVIPNAVGESAQTFAARGKVVGRQPQRICLNLNGNDIVGFLDFYRQVLQADAAGRFYRSQDCSLDQGTIQHSHLAVLFIFDDDFCSHYGAPHVHKHDHTIFRIYLIDFGDFHDSCCQFFTMRYNYDPDQFAHPIGTLVSL